MSGRSNGDATGHGDEDGESEQDFAHGVNSLE